jgi:hypothetical protein
MTSRFLNPTRERPRDSRPAPSALGAVSPHPTPQAPARRPGPARRGQPHPAEITLVVLPRVARDAAALASSAGRRRLDLPAPPDRPPTTRPGPTAADRPAGNREPALGYQRIKGELQRLGVQVSATAIRTTPRRHRLDPAPRRATTIWKAFCGSRPPGSWPATASPSIRSGCGGRWQRAARQSASTRAARRSPP